jgi:hypothetical protein
VTRLVSTVLIAVAFSVVWGLLFLDYEAFHAGWLMRVRYDAHGSTPMGVELSCTCGLLARLTVQWGGWFAVLFWAVIRVVSHFERRASE